METTLDRKLRTRKETADFLGISEVRLWRQYRDGKIAYRRFCGKIMFHDDDIAEFIERSKRPALAA